MIGTCRRSARRAYTLVALLVTFAIIAVLAAVMLGGLNTAVTGAGNTLPGSVSSFKDQLNLQEIYKAMLVDSDLTAPRGGGGAARGFPIPSVAEGKARRVLDTSAAMWSLAIMRNGIAPSMLISGNERNPGVEEDIDYDFQAYDPASGRWWDPAFVADLTKTSNVSFAHVPLWGERFDLHWARVSLDGSMPLLGTRGPLKGDLSAPSYTLGRNGAWAGHLCFGDGHVTWVESTTLPSGRTRGADNLFNWEEGPGGGDAILAFTAMIHDKGPMLQFD